MFRVVCKHLLFFYELDVKKVKEIVQTGLMPQSHHNFRLILAMKLLRIMLKNRCCPTTFHTTTTSKNADGWC